MPQHKPAGDAATALHRDSHAGEPHQARGQPEVSPTDHGELPAAASTPASIERASESLALFPPASAHGSVVAQANRRRVEIQSDRPQQIDVELLTQAILIIAEDMAAPPDRKTPH